jgi:uncharacterized protein (DUF2252 family)
LELFNVVEDISDEVYRDFGKELHPSVDHLENLLATIRFTNVLNDVFCVGTVHVKHLGNFFFVVDFLHELRIDGFF